MGKDATVFQSIDLEQENCLAWKLLEKENTWFFLTFRFPKVSLYFFILYSKSNISICAEKIDQALLQFFSLVDIKHSQVPYKVQCKNSIPEVHAYFNPSDFQP